MTLVWVLVGAAAFGYIRYRDRGTIDSDALSVGDCMNELPGATDGANSAQTSVGRVKTVPCSEPHLWEVFGDIQLPDGATRPKDVGSDARTDECDPKLAAYAPKLTENLEGYHLFVIYPSDETWASGDRSYLCLYSPDKPTAGSIHS